MKNFKKIIFFAFFLMNNAGSMLASLPTGTYQSSCSNCSMNGTKITCTNTNTATTNEVAYNPGGCATSDQNCVDPSNQPTNCYNTTSIDISTCLDAFFNNNGHLQCVNTITNQTLITALQNVYQATQNYKKGKTASTATALIQTIAQALGAALSNNTPLNPNNNWIIQQANAAINAH